METCFTCTAAKKISFSGDLEFGWSHDDKKVSFAPNRTYGLLCNIVKNENLPLGPFHLMEVTITWQHRGTGWFAWKGTYSYHINEGEPKGGEFSDEDTYPMTEHFISGFSPIPNGVQGDELTFKFKFGGDDPIGGIIISVVSDCLGY